MGANTSSCIDRCCLCLKRTENVQNTRRDATANNEGYGAVATNADVDQGRGPGETNELNSSWTSSTTTFFRRQRPAWINDAVLRTSVSAPQPRQAPANAHPPPPPQQPSRTQSQPQARQPPHPQPQPMARPPPQSQSQPRQQTRAAAETQRLERASRDRANEAEKILAIVSCIDSYVRSQNGFDHSNPRRYKCSMAKLNSDEFFDCIVPLHSQYPDIEPAIMRQYIVALAGSNRHFKLSSDCTGFHLVNLTPYQSDDRRLFGEYQCNCGRYWRSAGSWKDKYQKCQSCDRITYPHTQSILKKSEGSEREELRPHDVARCQKCVELGDLCLPSRYYAV